MTQVNDAVSAVKTPDRDRHVMLFGKFPENLFGGMGSLAEHDRYPGKSKCIEAIDEMFDSRLS